ncbi:MAG: acyl-coenzyme A thioesterase PaaI-like protein [Candidatus Poriferisodalaceae bacterium]|jgi:acyl-coenzyme A thioesterase PaaI-like protein
MTRRRLHNDDWGYATNCYVCEQRNASGLRIPFFHDEEADVVVAELELSDTYSGAPTLLHGGVQLAVLDEAMAWATIAVAGQWALTRRSTAEFHAGVHVGVPYSVVASIVSRVGDRIDTEARIVDSAGNVCTSATAEFLAIGEAVASRLLGSAVHAEHEVYLSDSDESAS